jgi:toxin secretion/phage lysis holin
MKQVVCSIVGALGGFIAYLLGGFEASVITLLIFMFIDYLTGLIVAGVFKNSDKCENGCLNSRAGWNGLCKKFVTLMFIIIANRLDIQMGTTFIRDAVCLAFISNELISIVENAGLMGIPIPKVITDAISVLKNKSK